MTNNKKEKLLEQLQKAEARQAEAAAAAKKLRESIKKQTQLEEAARRAEQYKKLQAAAEAYGVSIEELLDYIMTPRQVDYFRRSR